MLWYSKINGIHLFFFIHRRWKYISWMRTIFQVVNTQPQGHGDASKKVNSLAVVSTPCSKFILLHTFTAAQYNHKLLPLQSNQRSNALLKDNLLLKEEQTSILNLLWFFYFIGKGEVKQIKHQCVMNPCLPINWPLTNNRTLNDIIWYSMQRLTLLVSVTGSCHLKRINRFGKMLIASQHMVGVCDHRLGSNTWPVKRAHTNTVTKKSDKASRA